VEEEEEEEKEGEVEWGLEIMVTLRAGESRNL
jgi:hypothetical protein